MSSFTTPLKYNSTGSFYHGRPTYAITEEFDYAFGSIDNPLVIFRVPAGFVTDFASIPFPFNKVFPPDGPWAKAAVLHDWLISYQKNISKIVQDSIFLEAMRVIGVNPIIAWLFFTSVRIYRDIWQASSGI
jgi:hypothetical protein